MADNFISFLVKNLTDLLARHANLLVGLENEVRSLRSELILIDSFLADLEAKRNNQLLVVNAIINQIRDLAYEAEDVIDSYIAQQQGERVLAKWRSYVFGVPARTSIAEKIESIKKRLGDIYKSKETFGFPSIQAGEPSRQDSRRRGTKLPIAVDSDVVGLDGDAEVIINQLTGPEAGLHVVSIIGMGGLGKTTLARRVYNNSVVGEHFNLRAWIDVPYDYKVKDLLLSVLEQVKSPTDEMKCMSEDDLVCMLRTELMKRKYLIVLDDVWKAGFWNELNLNGIFGNNIHGSRILLTTRHAHVALSSNPSSYHHQLRFRTKAESWELLSKRVFGTFNCPPELKEIGMQIVAKCGGLPLALVVLAGILIEKGDKHRWWPQVLSRVSSYLAERTEHFTDILVWSYDYLPHHLKRCFLYLGLFPEDFEIPTRQLIQLWIAEGFIQQLDRESLEDTAEKYLEELIDRNLVQAVKLRFDGGVKACRVHDLLRELCVLMAKDLKLLEVCREPFSQPTSRRLGLHSNSRKYISSGLFTSAVRSFLCFGRDEGQLTISEWKSLYKSLRLLRVLDLWGLSAECIPNEVDRLVHLRYLRLKSHLAQTLPSSICNLWNLQVLEVKAPCVDRPIIDVWKMRELRHLSFNGQVVLPDPPKKDHDNALTNLQTLSSIGPESCTEVILSKFPELLKLGIHGDLAKHMDQVFMNVWKLNKLQTLKLERDRRSSAVTCLPDCSEIPLNITKLTISQMQLSVDPMQTLGTLPKLQMLKITNGAYAGEALRCCGGDFPELKVLKLKNLGIEKWDVAMRSMTKLRCVVIYRCSRLKSLPSAMRGMSTLQELHLWWPNNSLENDARGIQNHRGKDQFKLIINGSAIS